MLHKNIVLSLTNTTSFHLQQTLVHLIFVLALQKLNILVRTSQGSVNVKSSPVKTTNSGKKAQIYLHTKKIMFSKQPYFFLSTAQSIFSSSWDANSPSFLFVSAACERTSRQEWQFWRGCFRGAKCWRTWFSCAGKALQWLWSLFLLLWVQEKFHLWLVCFVIRVTNILNLNLIVKGV